MAKSENNIFEPKPSRGNKYCGACKLNYFEEYILVKLFL